MHLTCDIHFPKGSELEKPKNASVDNHAVAGLCSGKIIVPDAGS